jgi:hypothetical protein
VGCIRHENELKEKEREKEGYRRKEELLWN